MVDEVAQGVDPEFRPQYCKKKKKKKKREREIRIRDQFFQVLI
jgi:glutamine amidotransferase-like uncharacterized protein